MRKVRHLLQTKGNQVWSVGPDDTVYDALRVLAEKDIGALLVMDKRKLVGIFSERDYARKVILRGRSSKDTPVRQIMTPRVISVRPDQPIEECMAIMTTRRVRHLPVIEEGRVIGVISIGDVVKDIIAEQEFKIEQLENYISGTR